MRGYNIKSIDKYGSGDLTVGIAMWHFHTDFSLTLSRNGLYKDLISYQESQGYIHKISCNLTEFDKVFKQLKFDHTIIGLHISNSDVNSGTQTGLKI